LKIKLYFAILPLHYILYSNVSNFLERPSCFDNILILTKYR